MDNDLSDNLSNDISKMVHEQNEKVVKEVMKKELLQTLDAIEATGANVCYSDDMSYEELEKIVDDYEQKFNTSFLFFYIEKKSKIRQNLYIVGQVNKNE